MQLPIDKLLYSLQTKYINNIKRGVVMNKATKNLSIGMAVLIVCTIILFALTLKKPFLNIEDVGMTWLHSDNITKIVVDPGAGEQYVVM